MNVEDNKALVRRFIEEGMVGGDGDLIAEFCEPGSLFARGVVGQIASMHSLFPDLDLSIDGLIAEGDQVVARVRVTGTNTGPIIGLPGFGKVPAPIAPTGRAVSYTAVYVFTLHNGRIRGYSAEVDQVGLLGQLGWTFTPPGGQPLVPPALTEGLPRPLALPAPWSSARSIVG